MCDKNGIQHLFPWAVKGTLCVQRACVLSQWVQPLAYNMQPPLGPGVFKENQNQAFRVEVMGMALNPGLGRAIAKPLSTQQLKTEILSSSHCVLWITKNEWWRVEKLLQIQVHLPWNGQGTTPSHRQARTSLEFGPFSHSLFMCFNIQHLI